MRTVAQIVARTLLEYSAKGIRLNALRTSHRVLRESNLVGQLGKSLHGGKIVTSLWGLQVVYDERDVLLFGRLDSTLGEATFLQSSCDDLDPRCVRPYEAEDAEDYLDEEAED